MRFDIFTLFPGMFEGPFAHSIIKRAIEGGLVKLTIHDIRVYAADRHHTADDYSFGGGPGMVLKPGPIFAAVEDVLSRASAGERRVILMSPQGRVFSQALARELAGLPHLLLICGHYEGVDERVRRYLVDDEISIGDYVLTGGELPAMVLVDAVLRLRPGVLHDDASPAEESHSHGLLEYPQYTRPAEFRGWGVPPVLLSGDHARIAAWRRRQSILRTWRRRPELLVAAGLTPAERSLIEVWDGWAAGGFPIPDEAEA